MLQLEPCGLLPGEISRLAKSGRQGQGKGGGGVCVCVWGRGSAYLEMGFPKINCES